MLVTVRKGKVVPARLVGVVRTAPVPELPPALPEPPAPPEPEPPVVSEPLPEPEPPPSTPEDDTPQRLQQLFERLAAKIAQLSVPQPPLEQVQQFALELGIAVAERLVFEQIAAGAFGIEQLVRGALERLPARHAATVSLHPDDLALLQQRLGGELAGLHAEQPVQVRADATLARGDCRVHAGELSVWSNLRQRLEQAREILLEGIPREGQP